MGELFQMLFGFVFNAVTPAGWTASKNVTILQVDTTQPIVCALGAFVPYPSGSASDGYQFVCTAAGQFNAGIVVKAGETLWVTVKGGASAETCFGYVVNPDSSPVT
jgi:hypothetical protein